MWLEKKKKPSKSYLDFIVPIKSTITTAVEGGDKGKRKEKKKKKEYSTELQKPNVEAEVYNNKKCDWEKFKKK